MATLPNTLTDIANQALLSFAEPAIQNIDANTQAATNVKRLIYQTIREVQSLIDWPELRVKKTLNKYSEQRDETYHYYYLPNDFLDVIGPTVPMEWFLESGYFVTNETSVTIFYKKYSEKVSEWSDQMVELVYKLLAWRISPIFVENPQWTQLAERSYKEARQSCLAHIQSRRSGTQKYRRKHSWVQYREHGSRLHYRSVR